MHEWYKSLYLIASNLPLLVVAIRNILRKRYDKAAIALGTMFMSGLYHTAQTEIWVPESFENAQTADHTWVTIYFWYMTLYYLQFILLERFILLLIILWLATAFPAHLVATSSFYVVYIVFVPVAFLYQAVFRRYKFPRFGVGLFLAGMLVACIGLVFFFFNDGVNQPNYWWAHGSWHWFVLTAAVLIDLAEDYKLEVLWTASDRLQDGLVWLHEK